MIFAKGWGLGGGRVLLMTRRGETGNERRGGQ